MRSYKNDTNVLAVDPPIHALWPRYPKFQLIADVTLILYLLI